MKRILFCTVFLILLCFDTIQAQDSITIDTAILNSVKYISDRLPNGLKVVILNFQSAHEILAEYVIDELTMHLVNDGKLTVVDRQNLDTIRQEMNFQLSGDVSDESAQAIGKMLGAQTIISGAIAPMGNVYRLRVRAIAVETAAIQGVQNINIAMDETLAILTKSGYMESSITEGTQKGDAISSSNNRNTTFSTAGTAQRERSATATKNDNADRFSLANKNVFAISVNGMIGTGYGYGATMTLYERHFQSTLGLSFFANTELMEGFDNYYFIWNTGGGALIKWRFMNDRLIFNTGFAFECSNITAPGIIGSVTRGTLPFLGVQGGLSYRIARNLSLDINGFFKFGLGSIERELEYYGEEEYASVSSPRPASYWPYLVGVRLGITIMFPY